METKSDMFKDGEEEEKDCSSRSGDSVEEDNDEEEIKRKISCHSLYDLLVETHLDCLKVCLGITEIEKIEKVEEKSSKYKKVISRTMDHQAELNNKFSSLTMDHPAELDNFMEAYCVALSKLKEAMEEPHLESIRFINHMYSQLSELMELPSSASTPANLDLESGSIDCWEQLESQFLNLFYSTRRMVSMMELTNTRQSKDEPVLYYINPWRILSFDFKDQLSETSAVEVYIQGMH
ncbi:hypothetical protein CQW23_31528 [Capsicum baccatum]|uniref:Homeobox protein knotted-1-like 1 n=1 Tax=Capsicum baccatum TaxID=33114 RepID=A0A2G2V789_CAPBA|nr:hypothetical protein CQW23_31528 [Capsicum baccatum]